MRLRYNFFILIMVSLFTGCRDDFEVPGGLDLLELPAVEVSLSLNVNEFAVCSTTRAGAPSEIMEDDVITEEVKAAENRIDNIRIFQFEKATGKRYKLDEDYFEITDQELLSDVRVKLVGNVQSIICVVANSSDSDWGKAIATYNDYIKTSLPKPEPIYEEELLETADLSKRKSIPMEGEIEAAVEVDDNIIIDVVRMYAKLKISFGDLGQDKVSTKDILRPRSIDLNNIPYFCSMRSLADIQGISDESAPDYSGTVFNYSDGFFNTVKGIEDPYVKDLGENDPSGKTYVIYVPENLQGERTDGMIPDKAITVNITMMNGEEVSGMTDAFFWEDLYYTVYPGANDKVSKDNFNVRRNNVYRLKTSVKSVEQAHSPSSNCFAISPGQGIMFEPYYRVETGGIDNPENPSPEDQIFLFNNYLDPNDESKDKVIDYVQILWQTKNAIGDNTDGNLVRFVKNENDPLHSKIYVQTKEEGNALIGAFNSKDEIIWSWHLWISNMDPANVGNAVLYTTYDWDSNGIKNDTRVPGYSVMRCNLGALSDGSDLRKEDLNTYGLTRPEDVYRTHGMLYQWGRKDPFPPAISVLSPPRIYDDSWTGHHYDYSNSKVISKTSAVGNSDPTRDKNDPKVGFYSTIGNDLDGNKNPSTLESLKYSVANPLVFICGMNRGKAKNSIFDNDPNRGDSINAEWGEYFKSDHYFNKGDWMLQSNDKLWGALDLSKQGMKKITFWVTIHDPTFDEDIDRECHIFDSYGEKKSIFDPCPKGWRVSSGDLWLGFTKTGLNPDAEAIYDEDNTTIIDPIPDVNYNIERSNYAGMTMYMTKSKWDFLPGTDLGPQIFFPTQGLRLGDGAITRCCHCGNYHNATTDVDNIVNNIHIHYSNGTFRLFENTQNYILKSNGCPVRCVRDSK